MAELARQDAAASQLDPAQTLKAAKALVAHIRNASKEQATDTKKKSLLDEATEDGLPTAVAETPIWLTLTTKRHIHSSSKLKPSKIVVPYPLNDAEDTDTTICLITADPQRAYKNIVASSSFPTSLRERITRVIDFTHLKAKISKSYEAQRKLAAEHTVFLADDRIINRLPQALGKVFYKGTAKRPIPVVLAPPREKVDGKRLKRPTKKAQQQKSEEDEETAEMKKYARPVEEIVAEIEKAVGAVTVNLSASTDTSLRIGYASWTAEKIAANADAVAAALVERFVPEQWNNVRSIYIKGQSTAALPIWQTDELWMNGHTDVLPEGAEEKRVLPGAGAKGKKEKANAGKKRKAPIADTANDAEEDDDASVEAAPRPKKLKSKKALPTSNDDKLDALIANRKASLKKQKAEARKALEA